MSAYEALAQSYDRFTNDVPYTAVADFLEQVLAAHDRRVETVLDLACGTGSLSCLLSQRGYNVIGTDLSEDMLTVAYEKKKNNGSRVKLPGFEPIVFILYGCYNKLLQTHSGD